MTYVAYASDPPHVWPLHDMVAGTLAFDVGANGGETTRKYAARFGRVIAFEPASESFAHLNSERRKNVTAVCKAISDVDGDVDFDVRGVTAHLGELTTGTSLAGYWGETVICRRAVPALTLDSAARYYGQPDFIKIDTEGHEARVILGGDLIFEAQPRLFIEIHAHENLRPILERLQPHYKDLRLLLHDGYRPDDPLRADHFYLVAGF